MRIAILSRNFVATGGGAERYAIAVAEQLAAQHEVHVFAQTIAHQHPGIHYHLLPLRVKRPRWVNQLLFAWQAWRATRNGFDVVHSHENVWHGNVQTVHVLPAKHSLLYGRSGWALRRAQLRILTSPRLLTYLWLERMRFAPVPNRRIVATSGTLAQAMRQAYPATAALLHVITPGVALPEPTATPHSLRQHSRQALGLPQDGTCLLFVGNDYRKKGLPALLQAMALGGPTLAHCYLAVAGNPAQRSAMQALATDLGIVHRVHFLGTLRDMAMALAYHAADCLVHPTLQDSYAMVVLEAMAHSVPVLVSAAPWCGIADELTHTENALLITNPQDPACIATQLHTLLGQDALRQRLVQGGLAFARAHSWQHTAQAHEKLFATLMP